MQFLKSKLFPALLGYPQGTIGIPSGYYLVYPHGTIRILSGCYKNQFNPPFRTGRAGMMMTLSLWKGFSC